MPTDPPRKPTLDPNQPTGPGLAPDRPTRGPFDPDAPTMQSEYAPGDDAGPESRLGNVVGGRYRLLKVMAAGGMGQLYKGVHLTLGHAVAIKYMRPALAQDPMQIGRFRREAHALSLLKHPNIVAVLDFGVSAQDVFLVMEFLDGEPLSGWLQRQKTLPPLPDVAALCEQLLDGLEAAHVAGVVHRDLKPDNIFLARTTGGGSVVKLIDFGLAHVDEGTDPVGKLTSTGMVAGTPHYMSPEQCRSLSVGESSDLYAVGCILTEMLQGSPPFEASSTAELMAHHMFMQPPPLRRPLDEPQVPPQLEKLRLALLAKSPSRRPATAAEVRQRLREAFAPEAASEQRKQGEPLGGRDARIPAWERPAGARSSMPPPLTGVAVGLLRLGGRGDFEPLALGLASQGLRLVSVPDEGALAALAPGALVLDVGADLKAALAFLASHPARTVVCIDQPDMAAINELIAAGAADVQPNPPTAEALGKRLTRALRRKAR